MPKKKTEKALTLKKLFLSKEEKQNLTFRKMSMGFLMDLTEKDINAYLAQAVCPRLGIKYENIQKIDPSFEFVEVGGEKKNEDKLD